MESGELMNDISDSTMEAGFITCTAPPTISATQTFVKQAEQQIQLSELSTSMVQSLLSLLTGNTSQQTAPITMTNQADKANHEEEDVAETTGSNLSTGPVYVPTPKALLHKVDRSKGEIVDSPRLAHQVPERPRIVKVTEVIQQPLDTSVKSSERDQPLDLSGKSAATSTLHLPSHQVDQLPEQPPSDSEALQQPRNTDESSGEKDMPLDLCVKSATPEKLNPTSHQEHEDDFTAGDDVDHESGEVPQQANGTVDTRLVVITSDSAADNSSVKSGPSTSSPEGAASTQDDQIALDEADDSEEEEPVPSSASKSDESKTVSDKEQEENILSQILAPEPMELSSTNKRSLPDVDAPAVKKRKGCVEEPSVNISLVAINSLVTVLQDLRENERQRVRSEGKMTKILTDHMAATQKLTGAVLMLEEAIRNKEKGERKREERRQEEEKARLDERKRQREEEKKWEEKRWEMERIARGERRRAEEKLKGKESKPSIPSVLANKENNSRNSKKD
ncbi:MAG: hypothetical protein AB2693_27580 [Candidatus Thiodiazotropha sp.]